MIAQPSFDLQILLYVSDAAANLPPGTVATITSQARLRNQQDDISGLLVFDGLRFAQLLEGPAARIADLWERLRLDPRHTGIQTLMQSAVPARRFAHWQLGYLVVEPAQANLSALAGTSGEAALRAFTGLLPQLHIDLGAALPARSVPPAPRDHVPQ